MVTEVFLIRHGEALGQGTYLGRRSDPPLSQNGRAQVIALKSMLPKACSSRFCSSPMLRAIETSGLLFDDIACCSDLTVIDEFAEMDFGEWDGLGWQEISARADASYRAWLDDPIGLHPPGGEGLNDFNARVEKGFGAVIDDCRSRGPQRVFITAHGGVIRSILCSMLGLPAEMHWSFKIDIASVSCVRLFPEAGVNQPCRIEFLNLTAC